MPALDEPFAGLFTQGMVVHETYRDAGRRLGRAGRGARSKATASAPRDAARDRRAGRDRRDREDVEVEANTVDPDDIIATYGADTARWFMLSDSPPERDVDLDRGGRAGRVRASCSASGGWSARSPALGSGAAGERPREPSASRARAAQGRASRRCRGVAGDIERLRFNRCVAHIYELANALQRRARRRGRRQRRRPTSPGRCARPATSWSQLFAPMMPHLAEECWAALGHKTLVAEAALAGGRGGAPGRGHDHPAGAGQRQEARRRHGRARCRQCGDRGGRACARCGATGAGRQGPEEDHRRAAENRECRRLKLPSNSAAWPRLAASSALAGGWPAAASSRSTAAGRRSAAGGTAAPELRPGRRSTRPNGTPCPPRRRSPQRADLRSHRRRRGDPARPTSSRSRSLRSRTPADRRHHHRPSRRRELRHRRHLLAARNRRPTRSSLTGTHVLARVLRHSGQQQRFARARGLRDAENRAAKVIAEQIQHAARVLFPRRAPDLTRIMVALKAPEVDASSAQPDQAHPVVLVYGPERAASSASASNALVSASVDNPDDPFSAGTARRRATWPAIRCRLVEEANTIRLFGGRRAVCASRPAARNIAARRRSACSQRPRPDCRVVIEAGDLRKNAPLRVDLREGEERGGDPLLCRRCARARAL